MKNIILLLALTLFLSASAQNPAPVNSPPGNSGVSEPGGTNATLSASTYSVIARGPHNNVWQQVVSRTNLAGESVYRTNVFMELATGLNYWNGSQWTNANSQIQLTPNGASATNSGHQISFSANINTAGSMNLTLPDGRHLSSQIVGLAYFDKATSNSVMFAQTTDTTGQLLSSSNQVIYTNAFTDFQADVLYTHRKKGYEQDVILRSQPPSPTQYGLNPQTTIMQVWTEFLNPPEPVITFKQVTVNGGGISQVMEDQMLNFGSMQIGRGKAFSTESDIDRLQLPGTVGKECVVEAGLMQVATQRQGGGKGMGGWKVGRARCWGTTWKGRS